MGTRIERLPDEPIIVITIEKGFDFARKGGVSNESISGMLAEGESGVYIIYDLRELQMSFGDLVVALADHSQKTAGSVSDERLRPVVIGTAEMVKLGNLALQQEQYGGLKIPMFSTPTEALSFVREQIKKGRKS